MPDVVATRLVIEVTAGLFPNRPDDEYTRRYTIDSDRWSELEREGADALGAVLAELNGRAQGYAGLLMLQPQRLNWVRTDWIYL